MVLAFLKLVKCLSFLFHTTEPARRDGAEVINRKHFERMFCFIENRATSLLSYYVSDDIFCKIDENRKIKSYLHDHQLNNKDTEGIFDRLLNCLDIWIKSKNYRSIN